MRNTHAYQDASSIFDPSARVGDGLIRLDLNGVISYASPNARSAFNRMGWGNDLESFNLCETILINEKSCYELNSGVFTQGFSTVLQYNEFSFSRDFIIKKKPAEMQFVTSI